MKLTDELLTNCCKECTAYHSNLNDDEYLKLMQECYKSRCPVLELFTRYTENEKEILQLEEKINQLQLNNLLAIDILRGKGE